MTMSLKIGIDRRFLAKLHLLTGMLADERAAAAFH
jgi:hypothetical protein